MYIFCNIVLSVLIVVIIMKLIVQKMISSVNYVFKNCICYSYAVGVFLSNTYENDTLK